VVSVRVTEESALRIAARAFQGAPLVVKALTGGALLYVAGMLAWMVMAMGVSALTWPPFWGVLAGAGSALVLSSAYGLFEAAQGTWPTRWQLRLRPLRMNQMLLALPGMAFIAGVLGAISVASVAPLALRNPWFLAAALPPVAIVVFAARAMALRAGSREATPPSRRCSGRRQTAPAAACPASGRALARRSGATRASTGRASTRRRLERGGTTTSPYPACG
jgi:hypothetical protein